MTSIFSPRSWMITLSAGLACALLATPALAAESREHISFSYTKVSFSRAAATLDVQTRTLILDGTDGDDVIAIAFTDAGAPMIQRGHYFEGRLLTAEDAQAGNDGAVDSADLLVWQHQMGVWDDVVVDGRIITANDFDHVAVRGGLGNDLLIGGRGHDVALEGGEGRDVLVYDDIGGLSVRLAVLGQPAGDGDVVITNGEGAGGAWPTSPSGPSDAYFVKCDAETTTQSDSAPPDTQPLLDALAADPMNGPAAVEIVVAAGQTGTDLVVRSPLWTVNGHEVDPDLDVVIDLVDGQVQTSATIELEPVLVTSFSVSGSRG